MPRLAAAGLSRRDGCRCRAPAPGCCCAASRPGDYPRGGKVHLRLWLAERIADELGAANLAGARRGCALYARALGAEVGKHVDLHAHPAGDRPAHARATAARSSPRSTCAGHWIDGDVLHVGPDRGRRRRPRRRAQHAAAGRGRRRAGRDRARVGGLRRRAGRRVLVRRARRAGRPTRAGPWSRRAAGPPRRLGGWRTPPCAIADLAAAAAGRPGRRRASAVAGRARTRLARRARRLGCSPGCRSAPWSALVVLAAPGAGRSCGSLGVGLVAGHHPGAQPAGAGRPGRRCGSSTRRAPGSSRSTRARSPRRGCALLGAKVGRDVEASTVLLIPSLTGDQRRGLPGRRHAARRLRARRRLAAGRAGQDRQARLRRQLRHGRARSQGAQAGAGRRAVGRPAAQEGQDRHLVARQPAGAAAPAGRRRATTAAPTTRPRGCGSPRGLVELLPAAAADRRGRSGSASWWCSRSLADRAGRGWPRSLVGPWC